MTEQGFILTRQQKEIAGQCYLELWLTTSKGPVKLITPPQQAVFFVSQADLSQAIALLKHSHIHCDSKRLALKTFEHTPVAALYFNRTSWLFQAKQLLRQSNIVCYEDDIRLSERYLMERFIYATANFRAQLPEQTTFANEPRTQQPKTLQPRIISNAQLSAGDFQPDFKVLSIDIECSEHGELYSIGLAAQGYQRVLMIGESESTEEWIEWVADERALLDSFVQHCNQFDPDIFIGWNVINFDFQLLIKRAEKLAVKLIIGRGSQSISWRDSRTDVGQGFVTMPGRLVIDGIDGLKTATHHFDSFSLENVAQKLLGRGKHTEDVDNRLAAIQYDFIHNKVKLAEYNLQDCILVLDIFEQTKLLEFLTLRSQLTGLELDRSGGSVAAFLNLYLPKLHRAGYVAPNRPTDGGLASPGGYVMSSLPGLYTHVLVLDFKSLYPSIIRTFKVDPLGLVEGELAPETAIKGYKGAVFSRDKHFLPGIIESLWRQRDGAKKQKDSARSQAIKILMNSFYGVLGSGGCPFYDTRLASSITMRGHDIMQTTAKWIEQAGYKVIYGDTDSTFVWLEGDYTNQQAQQIGHNLQQDINTQWHKKIEDEHQTQCHLEIEFETHFERFLMPTIRGSELGSKKRYAGLKSSAGGVELVFKGLETVRSDWTELAKMFQRNLYEMVFADQDVESYIKRVIAETISGKHDDKLVYRKRLRQSLDKYVKNVPPHVKAARMADRINTELGRALKYQHKGWIAYVITVNGPEPLEYVTNSIDYEHYISKQIQPIAEGILPFIDISFEQLTSAQLGLF